MSIGVAVTGTIFRCHSTNGSARTTCAGYRLEDWHVPCSSLTSHASDGEAGTAEEPLVRAALRDDEMEVRSLPAWATSMRTDDQEQECAFREAQEDEIRRRFTDSRNRDRDDVYRIGNTMLVQRLTLDRRTSDRKTLTLAIAI